MNLTELIRTAVRDGHFLVGLNARTRLEERGVALWQIEVGLVDGLVVAVPSKPNPSAVVDQVLIDGTPVIVLWTWLASTEEAKLVSVFFPDRQGP